MSLTYRTLRPEEWDRLSEVVDPVYIPSSDAATVAIAEDENGKIQGCLFLQLTFHVEPLVLRSPKVSFERLHGVIYNSVSQHKGLRIYAFSDQEVVDKMAEYVGMKKLPYRVFEQEVM